MGAGDDERPAADEEALAQRQGHARAVQLPRLCGDGLGVVLADDVPHDDQIDARHEVFRRVALLAHDPHVAQHVAHGRVEAQVRAGHTVTCPEEKCGERAHARPGDTDEMHVHDAL